MGAEHTQAGGFAKTLREYYASIPSEYGFASKCKMTLLGDLGGKRVLDVNCRRGKGVVKLSSLVGARGFAMGTDPSPEWVDVALGYREDAWRKNGLPECNLDYRVGYPEDLAVAGIEDGSFDAVYCNSSITLAFDPAAALAEMGRVLRPGGTLVYDGVVAEGARDARVVAAARRMGNSVQAAFSRDDFRRMAADAGFDRVEFFDEAPVDPATGSTDDATVPVAESEEAVAFTKTTVCAHRAER